MRKMTGTLAAIVLALGVIPLAASANSGPDPVSVADVTVGVQAGQGCIGAFAEKSDVGYAAVAAGGYGAQTRVGSAGSQYNPNSTDMNDPNASLCAPAAH